jgi:hypothetical protein
MELGVQFVGIIRDGGVNSRVLVQAEDGLYYAWRTSSRDALRARDVGVFSVSAEALELASEQDLLAGRDVLGKVPVGSVQVVAQGVVSRGKANLRLLVLEPGGSQYYTVVVPVKDAPESGSLFEADKRSLAVARTDQIEAGLGLGTLRRRPRKRVAQGS